MSSVCKRVINIVIVLKATGKRLLVMNGTWWSFQLKMLRMVDEIFKIDPNIPDKVNISMMLNPDNL